MDKYTAISHMTVMIYVVPMLKTFGCCQFWLRLNWSTYTDQYCLAREKMAEQRGMAEILSCMVWSRLLSFSASKLRNLDVLSKMLNLNEQDYLGEASCALSEFYDSDRRFLAWGFGGRTAYGSVSHCFNLNGNSEECEHGETRRCLVPALGDSGFDGTARYPVGSDVPLEPGLVLYLQIVAFLLQVSGVEGIMSAYAMALHNVALAGPTLFGPVINKAAEIASRSLSTRQNKYFILLIITETKDAIVKASDLPMSILIVGVGGADYKEMEILDADNGKRLESSTGRIATRDIVQFVPMRDVQGK
ncbi:hypothetical protein GW17_00008090 [Ensete ventricosum]|nr:hypothetical protein GW17_00008090 [Ensete ventricosum]